MRTTYIHNFARTMAGQIRLESPTYRYCESAQAIARAIANDHMSTISYRLIHESSAIRSKLASAGGGNTVVPSDRVKMHEVHGSKPWINDKEEGVAIIHQMAATAVVAAMADNFWGQCERQRKADQGFLARHGLIA